MRSRCPTSLLGPCTVSYRVIVPDNVALDVRTTAGNVSLRSYRGTARVTTSAGAIDIGGYCGNSLDARSGAGAITVSRRLRAAAGVAAFGHRRDPRGAAAGPLRPRRREHVAARRSCAASTARSDAPYVVQVLSASGDVSVEGRS